MGSISAIMGRGNDISGTMATAVEEQPTTTMEMSRHVSEVAKGSEDLAQTFREWHKQRRAPCKEPRFTRGRGKARENVHTTAGTGWTLQAG